MCGASYGAACLAGNNRCLTAPPPIDRAMPHSDPCLPDTNFGAAGLGAPNPTRRAGFVCLPVTAAEIAGLVRDDARVEVDDPGLDVRAHEVAPADESLVVTGAARD